MRKDDKPRVLRGGVWYCDPAGARVADRDRLVPSYRGCSLGFRLARVRSPLERLAEAGKELNREKG